MAHVMPQVHMQLAHYINVNHTFPGSCSTFSTCNYGFLQIYGHIIHIQGHCLFLPIRLSYSHLTKICAGAHSLFITVYSPGYSLNCPVLFKITSPFSVNEMPGRYLHNHPVSCLPGTQPVADVISGLQSLSQPQNLSREFQAAIPTGHECSRL